jgi:hypothetical protein
MAADGARPEGPLAEALDGLRDVRNDLSGPVELNR